MNRLISFILSICLIFSLSLAAFANTGGSGNLDGGGGSMGSGSSHSYWNNGNEGVRATVIRASDHSIITVPIDFTNKKPPSSIYHFGKVSKVSYSSGVGLNPVQGGYKYENPVQQVPTIISSKTGVSNIEEIKKYFCSEYVIMLIAEITGMNYDILINRKYKLLLEPIAYIKFQGVDIAMTATEAALYDQVINGKLRAWMGALTHKNLPLAMFLEVGDLGYPAWNGSHAHEATNTDIISSLGLGIVRFTEKPEPPKIEVYDYVYRVNTEVITSVMISGGYSDPDTPTIVKFDINGTIYTVDNVYYPSDKSQLAWVKWTTPETEQDMIIHVTAEGLGGSSQSTVNVKIEDLNLNPPPNPTADDRNDNFNYSDIPTRETIEELSWTIWEPVWHENWSDANIPAETIWIDHSDWIFKLNEFRASINTDMNISNDSYNPTATSTTFKSGYGVNQEVSARVNTDQSSAVSKTPNAVSYFPEFGYQTYWRMLERIKTGSSSSFEFQKNLYSTYKNRTHFSPIWMPDGAYTVNTHVIDYWCPTGMLSANLTDSLTITGNLWQDWHIGPKNNN